VQVCSEMMAKLWGQEASREYISTGHCLWISH